MYQITESEFREAMNYCMLNNDMERVIKMSKQETPLDSALSPEMLERKKEKILRDKLKSTDGSTVDIHDQFYRDHKLLLKLFLYLGVMPVVRSSPGVITFSWNSSQMAYAFLLYCATTTIVLRVGYERLNILLTTSEFDEYIYAIIFITFLVPHFWIPFVGWGVAHQVATYKTMWGHFQVRYYRVTGESLTFPNLSLLIVVFFIGCVMLAILFLYSLTYLLEGFLLRHTFAYFHIITMINMNVALLFINVRAIKRASTCLSACFKKDINIDCNSIVVSEYRILWLNLSEILQKLGNAYARTYITFCLFLAINITITTYGSLSEIFDHGFSLKVLGMLVLTMYCATLLFVVCDCADKATEVVAQGVQETLLTVDLLRIEMQTQREIDHFIAAIELNPPVVNMQGYAMINRELLSSLISKIAVYLIVLLQFKLSLVAQKAYVASLTAIPGDEMVDATDN